MGVCGGGWGGKYEIKYDNDDESAERNEGEKKNGGITLGWGWIHLLYGHIYFYDGVKIAQ
jgi:hypothetical protein